MRKCIITITPDNPESQANVETGGCSWFEIVDALNVLQKHFAREIVEIAKKRTGSEDPKVLEKWIDDVRNKKSFD